MLPLKKLLALPLHGRLDALKIFVKLCNNPKKFKGTIPLKFLLLNDAKKLNKYRDREREREKCIPF